VLLASVAFSRGFCEEYQTVRQKFQTQHFSPISETKEESVFLFEKLLMRLDAEKLYFLQEDIEKLSTFQHHLLGDSACIFFDTLTKVYAKRLSAFLNLQKGWSETEKISFDPEKKILPSTWAFNKTDLKRNWNNHIHEELLFTLLEYQYYNDTSKQYNIQYALDHMAEVQKIVQDQLKCENEMQSQEAIMSQLQITFLNEYASLFDPHSVYLDVGAKDDFVAALSPTELSFGLDFSESKEGFIRVENLIPGGPAWSSGSIQKGDQLVALKKDGESIEISCLHAYAINALLSSNTIKEATFILENNMGKLKEIELVKEVLENEENILYSYLLNGPKRVGYIRLPDFYTSWSNSNQHGCANDVARELIKLKKQGVQGLILDLRYNGGGSTEEAVKLAGLFIDWGPVMATQSRIAPPMVIKDRNRGTIFDQPLVILVNGYSASSSELLASALQDYNRAVVVGSNTYGKGSFQQIIPVYEDQSFLKITSGKFYGINNASHQKTGLQPNIKLPEGSPLYLRKESDFQRALANDSIEKKIYAKKLPPLDFEDAKRNSLKRQEENDKLRRLNEITDSLLNHKKDVKIEKEQSFKSIHASYFNHIRSLYKVEDLTFAEQVGFSVENLRSDQDLFNISDRKKEQNKAVLDRIHHDLILNETYLIINDLIQ
jgi:carboxyl-terminal processing protease